MTHPGQRLSALIDGELEASERERVVLHVNNCGSCSDEYAALHALKRRMNAAFRENPSAGLTGLTSRLIGRIETLGLDDSSWAAAMPSGHEVWPHRQLSSAWPAHRRPSQDAASPGHDHDSRPDQRAGRLFLAGSVAIFLAGLGTAAVIAGGDGQARAPAPPVTPSVDVLVAPHNAGGQAPMTRTGTAVLQARLQNQPSFPAFGSTTLPEQP